MYPKCTHDLFYPTCTHGLFYTTCTHDLFYTTCTHDLFYTTCTHDLFYTTCTHDLFYTTCTHDLFYTTCTHDLFYTTCTHDLFYTTCTHDLFYTSEWCSTQHLTATTIIHTCFKQNLQNESCKNITKINFQGPFLPKGPKKNNITLGQHMKIMFFSEAVRCPKENRMNIHTLNQWNFSLCLNILGLDKKTFLQTWQDTFGSACAEIALSSIVPNSSHEYIAVYPFPAHCGACTIKWKNAIFWYFCRRNCSPTYWCMHQYIRVYVHAPICEAGKSTNWF